jgi:hypothetical protein
MANKSGNWTYFWTGNEELAAQSAAQWTDRALGYGPGSGERTERLLRDIRDSTRQIGTGRVPAVEH